MIIRHPGILLSQKFFALLLYTFHYAVHSYNRKKSIFFCLGKHSMLDPSKTNKDSKSRRRSRWHDILHTNARVYTYITVKKGLCLETFSSLYKVITRIHVIISICIYMYTNVPMQSLYAWMFLLLSFISFIFVQNGCLKMFTRLTSGYKKSKKGETTSET